MRFSDLSIAGKISVGGKILLAGVALFGVALFVSLKEIDRQTDAQTLTYVARAEIEKSLGAIEDQIASSRGYVITQNDRFIKSYDNAIKTGQQALEAARTAAAVNPEVTSFIDKVGTAAAAYRAEISDPQIGFARDPQTMDKAVDLAKGERAAELRSKHS